MPVEQKRISDGMDFAIGGIDSGRDATLLPPEKISNAGNCTMRGGFPDTRPGFTQIGLRFENAEVSSWFRSRRYQGAGRYVALSGNFKAASIAGRIFKVDITGNMVSDITPSRSGVTAATFTVPAIGASVAITLTDAERVWIGYPIRINDARYLVTSVTGNVITATNLDDAAVTVTSGATVMYLDVNSPDTPQVWMEQAGRYLVIQNDLDKAIIFDGARSFRAGPQQVPTGSVMAFGRGRLWVAINQREFVAGDIEGGPTEPIDFTENTFLNEGGAFSVPITAGPIRAMIFMPTLDESLGQGPLQVFAERAAYSINTPTNREEWKNLTDPIQTESLTEYSALSQWSTIAVNGDIFLRARDGLRSFILARREFGTWGNTPISREMAVAMKRETKRLLRYSSAIVFNNRVLFTVQPQPSTVGTFHRAIGVMDFDGVSSLGQKSPPIFEGIWTGIDPLQLIKGTYNDEERAFAFCRNADGKIELWEFSEDNPFDNTDGRIESWIELRSLNFGAGKTIKRLEDCEGWFDRIQGDVDLTLRYRSDQFPCWNSWGRGLIASKFRDCDSEPDECKTVTTYSETFLPRYAFGQPPEETEQGLNRPTRNGYLFQPRLDWVGKMRVRSLLAIGLQIDEAPKIEVKGNQTKDICYLRTTGTPQRMSVGPSGKLALPEKWTIEARVRPLSTGSSMVIAAMDDPAGGVNPWLLSWTSGSVFAASVVTSSGIYVSTAELGFYQTRRWYTLALSYDGEHVKFYINGKLNSNQAAGGTLFQSGGGISIGSGVLAGTPTEYFNGDISEFRIWETARTEAEIVANQRSTVIGQLGLVALWTFENGSLDSSGFNQNGTLEGSATIICEAGAFLATSIECDCDDPFAYRSNLATDAAGDTYPGVAAGPTNPQCPENYVWGGKGCVPVSATQECSTGYAWDGTDCVPAP